MLIAKLVGKCFAGTLQIRKHTRHDFHNMRIPAGIRNLDRYEEKLRKTLTNVC